MNKKNITLICIGILILTIQFTINIGGIYLDISNDILGFLLIIIGMRGLSERNITFKKANRLAVLGFILSILSLLLGIFMPDASNCINIMTALSVFSNIYFSYYFTGGLILESKFQEKAAVTRSIILIWALFGVLIFVSFILQMYAPALYSILGRIASIMICIYFCSYILNISSQLYMEGMPKKHMLDK